MNSDASAPPLGRVFLDANSTTKPFPEVVEVVAHHLRQSYGNPGSRHAEGRQARRVLESSRERLAELLGARPSEVIFTSGGTESANLALFGLSQGVPQQLALTEGEHPSSREACRALVQRGWQLVHLPIDPRGQLNDAVFDRLDPDRVRLMSVIWAHNETGTLLDLTRLRRYGLEHRVPWHVDAVQAVGKIPVSFAELGATALSLGAHKFHGPRGVGALLMRDEVRLVPQALGGHQESDRRAGTEPVALIAGMVRALELCLRDLDARTKHLTLLRDTLAAGLREACGSVVENGDIEHRLPNTLNMSFPGVDGEALLIALDLEGVACSLGSACASGSAEPAPVLVAMGCSPEVYRSAVRFSLSTDNTLAEVEDAMRRISRVVQRLR